MGIPIEKLGKAKCFLLKFLKEEQLNTLQALKKNNCGSIFNVRYPF